MDLQCRTLAIGVIGTRMITDKQTILNCNNSYYIYYAEIYVCVTTYTPSPTKRQEYIIPSIRNAVVRKWFCGCNHVHEMKWVELEIDSHGRKL